MNGKEKNIPVKIFDLFFSLLKLLFFAQTNFDKLSLTLLIALVDLLRTLLNLSDPYESLLSSAKAMLSEPA